MWRHILLSLAVLGIPLSGAADTLRVPADFSTIQAAIASAENADTIEISPGTYPEDLVIQGKTLHLNAVSGEGTVIIAPERVALTIEQSPGVNIWGIEFGESVPVVACISSEVWLSQCRLVGHDRVAGGSLVTGGGGTALQCQGGRVQIFDCELLGGDGSDALPPANGQLGIQGGPGGFGAAAVSTEIWIFRSLVQGGSGGNGSSGEVYSGSGGAGGYGMTAEHSTVILVDSAFQGGDSGNGAPGDPFDGAASYGGQGLRLGVCVGTVLSCEAVGGDGGTGDQFPPESLAGDGGIGLVVGPMAIVSGWGISAQGGQGAPPLGADGLDLLVTDDSMLVQPPAVFVDGLLGERPLTDMESLAGDLNHDGVINCADLVLSVTHYVDTLPTN